MAPGQDIFGLPDPNAPEQEEFAFLDADKDVQAPAPEKTPEEPQAEPGTEVLDEAAQQAAEEVTETPEGETPQETVERLWANKYKTPDELEKGYRNLSDLQRRNANARRQAEEAASQYAARVTELENILQQAVPYVESALARQNAPAPQPGTQQPDDIWGDMPAEAAPQFDPVQVQRYIDNTVAQRLSAYQQQLKAESDARQALEEADDAVYSFYETHPEVEMRGPVDAQVTRMVQELHGAWQQRGYPGFDLGDPEMLEVAYEAVKNPELKQVLELHPEYTESEAGMKLARFEAGLVAGKPITTQTATVPASQVGQRPPAPVTEKAAGGGTPEGADRPLNEFEQAVLEYRQNKRGGLGGSVFG